MKYIFIKKEILKNLYFNKKLSLKQISKILKISICTIEARLKEYGFKLRNKWEAKKLINQSGKKCHFYKDGRTLKKYYCKCGNEIHYDTWIKGKKTCIKCYLQIVGYFNKGQKRTKEIKKLFSLLKGGNGIPYSQQEHPKEFHYIKESIRKRDDYKCQLCNKTQIKNGKKLDVHHADYDRFNNNQDNLISLCIRCHRKTNFNRDFWKYYFNFTRES